MSQIYDWKVEELKDQIHARTQEIGSEFEFRSIGIVKLLSKRRQITSSWRIWRANGYPRSAALARWPWRVRDEELEWENVR